VDLRTNLNSIKHMAEKQTFAGSRGRAFLVAVMASLAPIAFSQAGTAFFDFESNPGDIYPDYDQRGNSTWLFDTLPGGGYNGYLSITESANGQRGAIVMPDIDNGLPIKAFTFEVLVRIGGGTENPADGFSLNYAKSNDPVIQQWPSMNGFAAAPTGEANLPEEGTQTGLGIGFDAWWSGEPDVIGISVRVENQLVYTHPMPNKHTTAADPTSLQTGPRSATAPDDPVVQLPLLSWVPLRVDLTEDGKISVSFKNTVLITNLQTTFQPGPGRLIFAGRTGDARQFQHVDNIRLTTVPAGAILPVPGSAYLRPDGFAFEILDVGASVLDPNNMQLKYNGRDAAGATVLKNGPTNRIYFSDVNFITPSGWTNTLEYVLHDTLAIPQTLTGLVSQVVSSYATVKASDAVPAASVALEKPGFKVRVHQLPLGRFPGDANLMLNAERHLRDMFINPATLMPYANFADLTAAVNGFFTDENYLNWSVNDDYSQADRGNFTSANGYFEEPVPGIPGLVDTVNPPPVTINTDNFAAEITTVLHLARGYYRFIVNSDDGFRVTTGPRARDFFAANLGVYDGGKGSSDVPFDVFVEEDGYYPVRLAWWEGGVDANIEFLVQGFETGAKTLINDTAVAGAIRAYQETTGASLPTLFSMKPYPGETLIPINFAIQAVVEDGVSNPLDNSTVKLRVDGADAAVAFQKAGTKTTVAASGYTLRPNATHTVQVIYGASGQTPATNSWTFTTIPQYAVIHAADAVPAASVNKSNPGFRLFVNQRGGDRGPVDGNFMENAERHIRGAYLDAAFHPEANLANLGLAGPDGWFIEPEVINHNGNGNAGAVGVFTDTSTPAFPDEAAPGIPGTTSSTDYYVTEILTFLELKAGYYRFCVNSDDGFKITIGNACRDYFAAPAAYYSGGRGQSTADYSRFDFQVEAGGIYPFRLLWWEGGGDASVEFFVENIQTGQRVLVNDPYNTQLNPVPAYWDGPVPRPFLWSVRPFFYEAPYENEIFDITHPMEAVLMDGTALQVNDDSIVVEINGAAVDRTLSNSGSQTTVAFAPVGGVNQIRLVYADTAGTRYTNEWYHYYNTPDLQSPLPLDSAEERGMTVRVWQISPGFDANIQPMIDVAEQMLAGFWGPNVANLAAATPDGAFLVDLINWNQDAPSGVGNFTTTAPAAAPVADVRIPGIPGATIPAGRGTDSIAASIEAYVEFPAPGSYRMGINSDDGFQITQGAPANFGQLVIDQPASAAGSCGAYSGGAEYGGAFVSLPFGQSITGKIVVANPVLGTSDLVNAAEVQGNIVYMDRGTSTFVEKANRAVAAGARALIVGHDSAASFPAIMGPIAFGDTRPIVPIPAIMIEQADGQKIKDAAAASAEVMGRIAAGSGPAIGTFFGGKGDSDRVFTVRVPQAGVYPMRVLWFEGGGGANIEWFTVLPSGQKILVNDPNQPDALKAYRRLKPAQPPSLTIRRDGSGLIIEFEGALESAPTVLGPWDPVSGSSPLPVTPEPGNRFYRARR